MLKPMVCQAAMMMTASKAVLLIRYPLDLRVYQPGIEQVVPKVHPKRDKVIDIADGGVVEPLPDQ